MEFDETCQLRDMIFAWDCHAFHPLDITPSLWKPWRVCHEIHFRCYKRFTVLRKIAQNVKSTINPLLFQNNIHEHCSNWKKNTILKEKLPIHLESIISALCNNIFYFFFQQRNLTQFQILSDTAIFTIVKTIAVYAPRITRGSHCATKPCYLYFKSCHYSQSKNSYNCTFIDIGAYCINMVMESILLSGV